MARSRARGSRARGREVRPRRAGKMRITIRLDGDVLAWFRRQARAAGGHYQSLVNEALREHVETERRPLEAVLRRVVREELRRAGVGGKAW